MSKHYTTYQLTNKELQELRLNGVMKGLDRLEEIYKSDNQKALEELAKLNELRIQYASQDGANIEICYALHKFIMDMTNLIYSKN